MQILHHGVVDGVIGCCHQLTLDEGRALLIDCCGSFQGASGQTPAASTARDLAWAQSVSLDKVDGPLIRGRLVPRCRMAARREAACRWTRAVGAASLPRWAPVLGTVLLIRQGRGLVEGLGFAARAG